MEITARDVLEAFVETGLKPAWGTYGDGKVDGCAVSALALYVVGRSARWGTPDRSTLQEKMGCDDYNLAIMGYEDARRKPMAQRMEQLNNPVYKATKEAAERLVAADKDARLALMEMDLEAVKAEAALV